MIRKIIPGSQPRKTARNFESSYVSFHNPPANAGKKPSKFKAFLATLGTKKKKKCHSSTSSPSRTPATDLGSTAHFPSAYGSAGTSTTGAHESHNNVTEFQINTRKAPRGFLQVQAAKAPLLPALTQLHAVIIFPSAYGQHRSLHTTTTPEALEPPTLGPHQADVASDQDLDIPSSSQALVKYQPACTHITIPAVQSPVTEAGITGDSSSSHQPSMSAYNALTSEIAALQRLARGDAFSFHAVSDREDPQDLANDLRETRTILETLAGQYRITIQRMNLSHRALEDDLIQSKQEATKATDIAYGLYHQLQDVRQQHTHQLETIEHQLQQRLRQDRLQHEATMEALHDSQNREVACLRNLQVAYADNERLRQTLQEAQSGTHTLRDYYVELNNRFSIAKQELQQSHELLSEAASDLTSKDEEIAWLEAKAQYLQQKLNVSEAAVDDLQGQLGDVQDQMQASKLQIREHVSAFEQSQCMHSATAARLVEAQEANGQMDREHKANLSRAERLNKELRVEREALREQNAALRRENECLRAQQRRDLFAHKETLTAEEIDTELLDFVREVADAHQKSAEENIRLRGDLQIVDVNLLALKRDCDDAEVEKKEAAQQSAELRQEKLVLDTVIQEKEVELVASGKKCEELRAKDNQWREKVDTLEGNTQKFQDHLAGLIKSGRNLNSVVDAEKFLVEDLQRQISAKDEVIRKNEIRLAKQDEEAERLDRLRDMHVSLAYDKLGYTMEWMKEDLQFTERAIKERHIATAHVNALEERFAKELDREPLVWDEPTYKGFFEGAEEEAEAPEGFEERRVAYERYCYPLEREMQVPPNEDWREFTEEEMNKFRAFHDLPIRKMEDPALKPGQCLRCGMMNEDAATSPASNTSAKSVFDDDETASSAASSPPIESPVDSHEPSEPELPPPFPPATIVAEPRPVPPQSAVPQLPGASPAPSVPAPSAKPAPTSKFAGPMASSNFFATPSTTTAPQTPPSGLSGWAQEFNGSTPTPMPSATPFSSSPYLNTVTTPHRPPVAPLAPQAHNLASWAQELDENASTPGTTVPSSSPYVDPVDTPQRPLRFQGTHGLAGVVGTPSPLRQVDAATGDPTAQLPMDGDRMG